MWFSGGRPGSTCSLTSMRHAWFINKAGASTKMTRLCARAPRDRVPGRGVGVPVSVLLGGIGPRVRLPRAAG